MNFRVSVWLTIATISLSSCFTTRIDNGFGGTWTPQFPSQERPIQMAQSEKQTVLDTFSHTILKDQSINQSFPVANPSHSIPPKSNSLGKKNTFKQRLAYLKKISRQKGSSKKRVQDFVPNDDSGFGHWFLFIGFIFLTIVGFLTVNAATSGKIESEAALIGFLEIAYAIFFLIGLICYDKLDECGDLYNVGFWLSMYAGWTIFPLLIWLLGLILCD